MNPGAVVLLLLGYGLAIPIGARITHLPIKRLRVAVVGFQIGAILAGLGWALRSSPWMAVLHIAGAVGARLYLNAKLRKAKAPL